MSTKKPKPTEQSLPLYSSIFGEGGKSGAGSPINLVIDDLHPFPKQPFRLYTEEKMQEMVESVTEYGMISPIVVRPNPNGEGYEIIAGKAGGICCVVCGERIRPSDLAIGKRGQIGIRTGESTGKRTRKTTGS